MLLIGVVASQPIELRWTVDRRNFHFDPFPLVFCGSFYSLQHLEVLPVLCNNLWDAHSINLH